jgi:hypothetical protein
MTPFWLKPSITRSFVRVLCHLPVVLSLLYWKEEEAENLKTTIEKSHDNTNRAN